MKLLYVRVCVLYFTVLVSTECFSGSPALVLASKFDVNKHPLKDYFISEKLDGVRAYWNGDYLVSRGGHRFAAPLWFIQELPPEPMDGELWGGRQTFDVTSGVVRRKNADMGWAQVRFMVFELPQAGSVFSDRYRQMQLLEQQFPSQYWAVVKQKLAPAAVADLQRQLLQLDAEGGEGFMLKRKNSQYRAGPSDDLLKVKLQHDADAVVLSHHQGKGRLLGMMGSISVRTPEGVTFRIGSGFSDKQRRRPPPIGATIRYKYNGLTLGGKPRFPVFWRVRNDDFGLSE